MARRLGLLPQSSISPESISVTDLVARGRYPYQSALRQWSREDESAVRAALAATGIGDLAGRPVDELPGGQRQRVWVAMVLAQQTPLPLLDEPTTFLDIAHQIELLELFSELNRDDGHTIVAVLHDLNHAARYASRLVAMRDGRVVRAGTPAEVLTEDIVRGVRPARPCHRGPRDRHPARAARRPTHPALSHVLRPGRRRRAPVPAQVSDHARQSSA